MTRFYSLLIVTLPLFSCKENKDSEQAQLNEKETGLYIRDTLPNSITFRPNYSLIKTDTSTIKLDFFEIIPETIGNPVEFFTYDTVKLTANKFIFLTNSADYAIIRNNGQDIYLKKEHKKSLKTSENTFTEEFSGNAYTIILNRKLIDHANGASLETGSLEIKNSKHKVVVKIHGGYKII